MLPFLFRDNSGWHVGAECLSSSIIQQPDEKIILMAIHLFDMKHYYKSISLFSYPCVFR